MSAFDWRELVRTIAPTLGTALGGPLGGAAGAVLAKALGTPDASDKTLGAALAGATPDQLLAIQKAEQEFELKLRELGFENLEALERIAADDRANAREREVRAGDSWTPRVLAGIVICGWLGIQWFLLTHIVPADMREIVVRCLGTLDLAVGLVLGYYFGSSAGSAVKTDILAGGKK